MKERKPSFIIILTVFGILTLGCNSRAAQTFKSSSTPVASLISTANPSLHDQETNEKEGIFNRADSTFSIKIPAWQAKYGGNSIKAVFSLTLHDDSSNVSGLYIDDIQMKSLTVETGWDSVELVGISDIAYSQNHQNADVDWSYTVTQGDESDTESITTHVSLYNEW